MAMVTTIEGNKGRLLNINNPIIKRLVGKVSENAIKVGLKSAGSWLAKKAAKHAIAKYAGAIIGGASTLMAGPLGPVIGMVAGEVIVYAGGKAISYVAGKLGVVREGEKAEEVGKRLDIASTHYEWKTESDFKDNGGFKEYYKYLREQIPDAELNQQDIAEHRLEYSAMGIAAMQKGISEELNTVIPLDLVIAVGTCNMKGDELQAIIERFAKNGYDMELFTAFLKGELDSENQYKIGALIGEALKQIYPEMTDYDIIKRIQFICNIFKNDNNILSTYEKEFVDMAENDIGVYEVVNEATEK